MAEGGDFRNWDELIPDALGLIFSNLPLREVLTVIPTVCKSWYDVVIGPYCWQEIDIEEWSSQWPDHLEELLQLLIMRSCGSLRKLCVSGLENDEIFSFIAEQFRRVYGRATDSVVCLHTWKSMVQENIYLYPSYPYLKGSFFADFLHLFVGFASADSLQTLRIPRSEISDSIVEQVAGKLSTITFLDVSYCNNIGAQALEAIGKQCKLLTGLRRNMHPLDVAEIISQDDEAHAIAATMSKLKHLEMAYLLISTSTVLEILASCPELELLDIRGCWNVKLDEKFLKEKVPKLKVLGPIVVDQYEGIDWAACSDLSDSTDLQGWDNDYESSDGVWDEYGPMDELHLSIFEGFVANAWYDYDWPPSP